jgi:hypothetical protein
VPGRSDVRILVENQVLQNTGGNLACQLMEMTV